MDGLTERQSEVLAFIRRFIGERGFSPSYQEIAEGVGLVSKSNAYTLVGALVERGYVSRPRGGRARTLAIIERIEQ